MIKVAFIMTSCRKSGPIQQMLNIIKNLNRDEFDLYLVTLYEEDKELSQLDLYKPYVKHILTPESKLNLLLGRDKKLRETLDNIKPNVIHTLGVLPDFAISRLKKYDHILTLRCFVFEDYIAKFGIMQGAFLSMIHIYAMLHTKKTVTCSESLAKIYKKKLGFNFDYVRNGVDLNKFRKPAEKEILAIRKEMCLPIDSFIFAYTGQLIERKNIDFLLRSFVKTFKDKRTYLLVLGGGVELDELKAKYDKIDNIDFRGNVMNVNHYLKACDAYVSASKSEGLPNGVLEAMATGLPVVLSDIPQHIEIHEVNTDCGFLFDIKSEDALSECMKKLVLGDFKRMGDAAYNSARENFSATLMGKKYEVIYKQISGK